MAKVRIDANEITDHVNTADVDLWSVSFHKNGRPEFELCVNEDMEVDGYVEESEFEALQENLVDATETIAQLESQVADLNAQLVESEKRLEESMALLSEKDRLITELQNQQKFRETTLKGRRRFWFF